MNASKTHAPNTSQGAIRELSAPEIRVIGGARLVTLEQIPGIAASFTSNGGPTATKGIWPRMPNSSGVIPA